MPSAFLTLWTAMSASIWLISIVHADILCCILSPYGREYAGLTFEGVQVLPRLNRIDTKHPLVSKDDYQCAKPGDYTVYEDLEPFSSKPIPGHDRIFVQFCCIKQNAVLQEGKLVKSEDVRMTYHTKRLLGDPPQHPHWSDASKHVRAMQLALAAKKS